MALEKVVVSRNPALRDYLIHKRIVHPRTPFYKRPEADQIMGKHVYGFLPLHLAILADRLTVVTMADARGEQMHKLTLEDMRNRVVTMRTYKVSAVDEG